MNAIMKVRWTAQSVGLLATSILGRRERRWSIVQRRVPLAYALRAIRQKCAVRRETAYLASKMQFGRALVATSCWRSFRALEAYTRALSLSELPASALADPNPGVVNNVLSRTSHETYSIALAPLENMIVSKALISSGHCKPLITSMGPLFTAGAHVYRPEDGGKTEAPTDLLPCAQP